MRLPLFDKDTVVGVFDTADVEEFDVMPYRHPAISYYLFSDGRWARCVFDENDEEGLIAFVVPHNQAIREILCDPGRDRKNLPKLIELGLVPDHVPNCNAPLARQEEVPARRARTTKEWEIQAMLILKEHPDWNNVQVADELGIDKTRLSKMPMVKAFRDAHRVERGRRPRGHRCENGTIEAYTD